MSTGSGGGSQQNPAARLAIGYAESNVQLVSIGLQLFMCIYGLVVYLESSRAAKKGRILYVAVSFTILGLSVMTTVCNNYSNYNSLLNTVPGDLARTRIALNQFGQGTPSYGIARIASTFIAFVGDGLLLYRCYFFWSDKRWVVVLPALVYLASVVMGILQMLWQDIFSGWVIDFSVSWVALNATLNALITGMISYSLLRAYFKHRDHLPPNASRVYLSVVAILVEAALPLSLAGIVLAALMNQSRGAGATGVHQGFFRILYFFLLAISPQMIIFRITTGRSAGRKPNRGSSDKTTHVSTAMDFVHSSSNAESGSFDVSQSKRSNHDPQQRSAEKNDVHVVPV
ncbi:hypothetical protein FA15DRAFT_665520 [Coprinopsis marcescibilis]|uniref:Uncharacterized protein n=1 Tax=Coprinopsis marcescibilis TaxID=230819 RepID=A0A5C3LIC5_COPMA|nr:hypothetical protein FA15DRAFT_665520 [Coprinopsis marcescibilis]